MAAVFLAPEYRRIESVAIARRPDLVSLKESRNSFQRSRSGRGRGGGPRPGRWSRAAQDDVWDCGTVFVAPTR